MAALSLALLAAAVGTAAAGAELQPPPQSHYPPAPTVLEVTRIPAANMTRARLEAAIKRGELLLIEGGAAQWKALDHWSLEWFERQFPDEPVEFRMHDAHAPDTMRAVGQGLTLGTYRRATKAIDRPYYLGWGNQHEDIFLKHFKPYMRPTPKWFPADYETQGWLTEWMYFGSHDSGVPFHVDPQCFPKFSVHISGDKLWVLRKWWGPQAAQVEWRTVVRRGDILLFYPQLHHHTVVLSNHSLAYTAYFSSARDTPFIRELIAACEAHPDMGKAFNKCYRKGSTLEGMTEMCARCAALSPGESMRPHLCDIPAGIKMCDDLRAGRVRENELPWEIGGKGRGNRRAKGRTRVTFSEPTDDTKRVVRPEL